MQARPSITRTGDPYLFAAQIALREMRDPSLLVALDNLALLAELKPERFPTAAVRWHGTLLRKERPTLVPRIR